MQVKERQEKPRLYRPRKGLQGVRFRISSTPARSASASIPNRSHARFMLIELYAWLISVTTRVLKDMATASTMALIGSVHTSLPSILHASEYSLFQNILTSSQADLYSSLSCIAFVYQRHDLHKLSRHSMTHEDKPTGSHATWQSPGRKERTKTAAGALFIANLAYSLQHNGW